MLRLMKVAVTGSLSSGKSSVCRLLQQRGAITISADAIVHQLFETSFVRNKIKELFGSKVFRADGLIDRSRLSQIVFQDDLELKRLEQLLHPLALEEIQKRYDLALLQDHPKNTLFVVEVPLLFEAGWQSWFDKIIAVEASVNRRKERFTERGFENLEFERRTRRLLDPSQVSKQSHFVIINDQDLSSLKNQVENILKELNPNK
jgi:dephospho-CoA kinase